MARHSRRSSRHSKATILATQLKMRNCGAALDTVMSMPKGAEKRAGAAAFKLACVVGKKSKSNRKSGLAGILDDDNGTPFDGLGAAKKRRCKRTKSGRCRRRRRKAQSDSIFDYQWGETPSRREHAAYRFDDDIRRYRIPPEERRIKTSDPLRKAVRSFIRRQL